MLRLDRGQRGGGAAQRRRDVRSLVWQLASNCCSCLCTLPRFASRSWLAADVLFLLPGIADFLRWNATEGVGASNMRRLMAGASRPLRASPA